jgi:hypothetical protein
MAMTTTMEALAMTLSKLLPARIPNPLRRSLILDDFFLACSRGRMTHAEREQAIWIMGVTGWRLENVVGVPNVLVAKMQAASVFLRDESAERGNSDVILTDAPVIKIDVEKEIKPVDTFGLTKSDDNDYTTED